MVIFHIPFTLTASFLRPSTHRRSESLLRELTMDDEEESGADSKAPEADEGITKQSASMHDRR